MDTVSQKRIVMAYDYLWNKISKLEINDVRNYLNTVLNASCTTHKVDNESEAIQMFIFQNNRGKRPTDLEIIKAQFLYNIHISDIDIDEKNILIDEIRNRFESIYKNISKIEDKLSEDEILFYTLRIYFNSLWEDNPKEKVNDELNKDSKLTFIQDFTHKIASCFEAVSNIFDREKSELHIHSLLLSGQNAILYPFIIKVILNKSNDDEIIKLSNSLESIFIRSRIIGTRADLRSRLNEVFQQIDEIDGIDKVVSLIEWMKTQDGWWGHWNNNLFKESLQGYIEHNICKILLYQYENYLLSNKKMDIQLDMIV